MAVDCVPSASRTLKKILSKKELSTQTRIRYERWRDDYKEIKGDLPENELAHFRTIVKILKRIFDRREREWLEAEKKLCPLCKGEQWDPHYSGQMSQSCSRCGGTGLMSSCKAHTRKMFGDIKRRLPKRSK
jgi:hypothetical protein